VLNLVKDDRRAQGFKEGARVATHAVLDIGVFEEYILRFWNGRAQKGGLSRTPWPSEDGCREASKSGEQDRTDLAGDEWHLRIIKWNFK
jgi:hypothetical protein